MLYWDEAFATAVHLINRLPSSVLNFVSLFETLHHKKPFYKFFRTFYCAYFSFIMPYNKNQLQFRSTTCIFLGFSPYHRGYKCLDIASKRIYIVHDVVFYELQFPFAQIITASASIPSPNSFSTTPPVISQNITSFISCHNCFSALASPSGSSYSSSSSHSVNQIDINNAFLNDYLTEDVCMTQPQGFEAADKTLVCKLQKSLYRLKQAPRAWFSRLSQALLSFGFIASKCDHSLFIKRLNGRVIYVLVYVDDILITGTSATDVQSLISQLHSTFSLKNLGKLDYFLGIKVTSNSDGSYILSQEKYVDDLLHKAGMVDATISPIPMVKGIKLSKDSGPLFSDSHFYRSIVGGL